MGLSEGAFLSTAGCWDLAGVVTERRHQLRQYECLSNASWLRPAVQVGASKSVVSAAAHPNKKEEEVLRSTRTTTEALARLFFIIHLPPR